MSSSIATSAHPSKSDGEDQVIIGLKRTSDLTIGDWTYTMLFESSATKTSVPIESAKRSIF